jgi:hypothetical protein
MQIQKVTAYRSAFIVQLFNKKATRIETVDENNKIKVRKSVHSAKCCITREINKRKSAQA